MISLKIKYNGKYFMMSSPINSLDEVTEQVKERFPNSCPHGLVFWHEGKMIKKLQDALDIAKKDQTNIIKVEAIAKKTGEKFSSSENDLVGMNGNDAMDELKRDAQKKKEKKENKEEKVRKMKKKDEKLLQKYRILIKQAFNIKQNEEKSQQDEEEFPISIYKCFYCQNQQIKCRVCNGLGKFTSQSPFIQAIDNILSHRSSFLQKKQNKKNNFCENNSPSQTKSQMKEVNVPALKILKKDLSSENEIKDIPQVVVKSSKFNKKRCHLDSEFKWTFCFEVEENYQNLSDCYILNQQSKKTLSIRLKKGCTTVAVGPFQGEVQGEISKTFRLFYYNKKSEMVFFGNRFGFTMEVIDWNKKKAKINEFRETVKKIKEEKNLDIFVDQSLTQLRQVGINEDNYQQNISIIENILVQS